LDVVTVAPCPDRAVLADLLDKYTDHGVTPLDDLHILEVPPLSKRGTPLEISSLFGGPNEFRGQSQSFKICSTPWSLHS